jgi:CBS domain-containing protein
MGWAMSIADILRHKTGDAAGVVTVNPAATVTAALAALAEHNIGALLVVDDGGLRGILSERDIVRRLAATGATTLDEPVSNLMTTDVVTCGPRDAVDAIAETMTARRIRHMPVLDGEQLVGIVSIGDVVLNRIRQLEQDRGQLEQYIAG